MTFFLMTVDDRDNPGFNPDAATHSLLTRSRKWSSLRAWGMQVARRRGMARARVAVARKLAVMLHRIWRDETEFRFGKDAPLDHGRLRGRRPRRQ